MGDGRGSELFVGIVALALVPFLVKRVVDALRSGEVPLYRKRMTKAELGGVKFALLVGLNIIAALALIVIGVDLVLGLGLRG
jgi:hypothetical protein